MATRVTYPWTRWWVPVGTVVPEYGGFPEDPQGPWALYVDNPAARLQDLDDVQCLLLFGDSGLGKTSEIDVEVARLAQADVPHLHVQLGEYESWADVENTIAADADVQAWAQSPTGLCFLFIDGVDEVAASISVLADRLPKLLRTFPLERLRVRVAGRAYAFPTRLRSKLAELFPGPGSRDVSPAIAEYDLLPLTRSNVFQAANASGRDGNRFLVEVDDLGVGVFASRPITLNLYLDRDPSSPLPPTRAELYEEGTQRLVRESNGRVLDAGGAYFPVGDLIRGAQKLAAVSLLASQSAISIRRRPYGAEHPSLDELAADGAEAQTLRAVTGSSLFGVNAAGTVRWTHRDFAEFLTAQRLAVMSTADALALLADPTDPAVVVPQLAGTAAWTAQLHEGVFDWLVTSQPELLAVPGTFRGLPDERRRSLMRGLMARVEAAARVDVDRMNASVDYPQLAEDLAPYLDAAKPFWVRREAILLLHDAGRQDLDEQLMSIVDVAAAAGADAYDDDVRLAVSVVLSFRRTVDDSVVDRLLGVAGNSQAPFELRQVIVDVLANFKPTPDLLTALTNAGFTDTGARFLDDVGSTLARAVQTGRIPASEATKFIITHGIPIPAEHAATNSIDDIIDNGELPAGWFTFVVACVAAASAPGTVPDADFAALIELLTGVLDHTLHDHAHLLRELPPPVRRRIAAAVLDTHPSRKTAARVWHAGLLNRDDFQWTLTCYGEQTREDSREAYATIGRLTGPAYTPENRDAYLAAPGNEKMREFLNHYFSNDVMQEVAEEAARSDLQAREQDKRRQAREFNVERLTDAATTSQWAAVANEMMRPVGDEQPVHGASLTETPAWQLLDQQLRDLVQEVAASYLQDLPHEPDPEHVSAVGDAYSLLADTAYPDRSEPDVLAAWFPLLLNEPGQHRAVESLAVVLQATNFTAVEATFVNALNSDLQNGVAHTSRLLGEFTSAAVEDALDKTALNASANSRLTLDALTALAARDAPRTASTALTLIRQRPQTKPEPLPFGAVTTPEHDAWDKTVGAAAALATSPAIDGHLHELLDELTTSPDYAKSVIGAIENVDRHNNWPYLTTQQLGILYEWADANLPKPGPYRPGVHNIVAVHDFPRHLLNALKSRADTDAVAELRRLANRLGDDLLNQVADEVADTIREATWAPLTPRDVLALLDQPTRRAIHTEAQLAQALIAALDAVAHDIATNISERALYWHPQHSTTNSTYYIPPDEPNFMNRLGLHMRQHLHGVNLWHEVELNHRLATIPGSEADILATVQATPDNTVSVVIEGKGNWNRDVKTAIETQLHDRYLTGSPTSTGIYVVGAFHSPYWLEDDTRQQRAQPADQLRVLLTAAAERLSRGTRTVTARVIDIPLDEPAA